jgi:hypothetical protein
VIRLAGAPFLTFAAIISVAFCGCFQAEVRTAAVLSFHAAPGFPADMTRGPAGICSDSIDRELGILQPYRISDSGENAEKMKVARKEKGENAWTLEALERAAELLEVDLAVTANIYSRTMKPDGDSVLRPYLNIEYLFVVPAGHIKGVMQFARILTALEDDSTADSADRLRKAVEVSTNRFIKRLLEEFN